jgi:dihydroorotase
LNRKPRLLLRGATLLDPERGAERPADVLIEDGRVTRIGRNIRAADVETWDLAGKYLAPGFIDLHCHLREPGREDEETIASGTLAALAGGFTTVCCMPNTEPAIDHENVVRAIVNESARIGQARVLPIAAATKGRQGAELAEIGALVSAGAVAVSDDGNPIAGAEVMRRVLEYSKIFDVPVINHCEEPALTRGGVMHEGAVSARLGLPGMPAAAEEIMVSRDIRLAEFTQGRLHIAHVSAAGSVELVRRARDKGIAVTCETCPHYFTLTDEHVSGFDPNYKMNPPLRTAGDVQAIKEGLADGTIDAIATDHAPHLASEKLVELERAPFGIIGLQTAFSLGIRELVKPGILTLAGLVAKLTAGPARVLKLTCTVAVGAPANIVVLDPKLRWTYRAEDNHSLSANSPFLGQELTGKVLGAIIQDRVWQF